jgi:hypothetical protein
MTKRAQQFEVLAAGVMDSGSPIATGYVRFYEAGTTTLKNAYADKDKGSSFTKLALDADSRGVAYGDGVYKLKFYAGDPDNGGTDTGITIDNYKCTAVLGAIRTVTSADDIDRDDELVLVDTTSGDITVTLADVDTFDNPVTIKKIAAGNTVTIATTDSQNIDSDSTKTLTLLGSAITVYPDTTADLWRVQNPVVSELTATATEINTACDGITATASEINTACDGITKTAAELNLTGSAGTFVNEANDQPVAVTGEFDIDSSVVETAWESVGPTGAGADNTWTALDSVDADADWIQVRIACESSDSASSAGALRTTRIYARGGDGSQGVGPINQIHKHAYYNDASGNGAYMGQNTVKIPVDSNIVFDVNWTSSCESLDADLYLIGWGFNP